MENYRKKSKPIVRMRVTVQIRSDATNAIWQPTTRKTHHKTNSSKHVWWAMRWTETTRLYTADSVRRIEMVYIRQTHFKYIELAIKKYNENTLWFEEETPSEIDTNIVNSASKTTNTNKLEQWSEQKPIPINESNETVIVAQRKNNNFMKK